jgi:predicted nucleotidyltransferase
MKNEGFIMEAVGIIVEYNPFHNGHQFHVDEARRLSSQAGVIAVMSGSFVQRGEPAITDKWCRAHMAITGGVDLVFELPTVFALRSAQYFAAGAIRLLAALGCVSHICFGAEEPNMNKLIQAFTLTNKAQTVELLKTRMRQNGSSYASALAEIIQASTDIALSPNNILAIEYLRALDHFAPNLTPLLVNRRASAYHDQAIAGPLASATAIRKAITINSQFDLITPVMPARALTLLQRALQAQAGPATIEALAKPIIAALRLRPLAELTIQAEMKEGLQNKIKRAACEATDWASLLAKITSKRYTPAKIKRILLYTLLQTTAEQLTAFDQSGPLYARVLAFNERGRMLLKTIAKTSTLPVIVKTAHCLNSRTLDNPRSPLEKMLAIDAHASDIYGLCLPTDHWLAGGQDFLRTPLYIH